jgi:hypothetical protein
LIVLEAPKFCHPVAPDNDLLNDCVAYPMFKNQATVPTGDHTGGKGRDFACLHVSANPDSALNGNLGWRDQTLILDFWNTMPPPFGQAVFTDTTPALTIRLCAQ